MLTSMLGVALIYFAANESVVVEPPEKGVIYYEHPTGIRCYCYCLFQT